MLTWFETAQAAALVGLYLTFLAAYTRAVR